MAGQQQAPAQPWWETTPWWNLRPKLADPTTWPVAAPVAAFFGGAQSGGPNWLPVASPLVGKPVGGAWNAVAQGMAGAGGNLGVHLFGNPQPSGQPAAPAAKAPGAGWSFDGGQPFDVSSTIRAESRGNPNARNPWSSATGLGQFIDSTWMDADLRKRAGYDKIDDASWKALKQGEAGAAAQTAMTQAYAQRNAEQWEKKFQRAPDPGQLYGMHFLDAQPFMLLTETAMGNPQADASKMFPAAAKANPEIFFEGKGNARRPRTAAELYTTITGKVQAADPFTAPTFQAVPNMAGMIPNPTTPRYVNMPDAPQMGFAPERPQAEELPVGDMMAQLQKFAPPSFDRNTEMGGRLGQIIAGMAAGAGGVDPMDGVGAILLGAGGGAANARVQFDKALRVQEKEAAEAQRVFGLSMALREQDFNSTNRGIRAENANRKWQDARDKMVTEFENKQSQWRVDTQEYLTNNNLGNQYIRDLDQAALARARVAMQAVEQNVDLYNREQGAQADLDLKRFLFENDTGAKGASDQQIKTMDQMLAGIGLDAKVAAANKDTLGLNAAQGALYIAANNKQAAINALGRELALAGAYDVIPDKKVRGELELLAKQDPTGELSGAAIGRLLNEGEASDPGSALDWAKVAAARGLPVGQLFLRHIKQAQPAPQQQQQGGANVGAR